MKNLEGGCLCGNIQFRVKSAPDFPHTCSCSMCQKHTGALSVAWVEFSGDDVEWTGPGGAPSTYRSSEKSSRAFCSQCGSSLGAIDDSSAIGLLTGVFTRPHLHDLKPTAHSYMGKRPKWWKILIDLIKCTTCTMAFSFSSKHSNNPGLWFNGSTNPEVTSHFCRKTAQQKTATVSSRRFEFQS